MVIDPVCEMHIDPANAPEFSQVGEDTFYFCSETCKRQFDANPEPFIEKAHRMNPLGYDDVRAA